MKNTAKNLIKSLTTEQNKRTLQFDSDTNNTCSLGEFLKTNLLDKDVEHILICDAESVIKLEVGQETYIPAGFGTIVKRIS